jgi:hypothetical protein
MILENFNSRAGVLAGIDYGGPREGKGTVETYWVALRSVTKVMSSSCSQCSPVKE